MHSLKIFMILSLFSFLMVRIVQAQSPDTAISMVKSSNTWEAFTGQGVSFQEVGGDQPFEILSLMIDSITIHPLPVTQGNTMLVDIKTKRPVRLSGNLGLFPLEFVQAGENHYFALQGISAMMNPGLYLLRIIGDFFDLTGFDYQQNIRVQPGNFPQDPPLTVPPETMDPAITGPETQQVANLVAPVTPDKLWSGPFVYPVDEPCINSGFGDRRSYNGSDYDFFHSGLDFGTCANNLNIYAPAPGRVVFTGMLTVRGNTVIIDHGWGVYSGFYHQSHILVHIGQKVSAGELISLIGATGRVNGPHLHWDLFVNGVQVQPLDWIGNVYP
jgi:murein DD-endopeptidase MepM/ murein hydrolase activator NlpD